MAYPQMCSNFVRQTIGLYVMTLKEAMSFEVRHLLKMLLEKTNPKYPVRFYFSPRPKHRIIEGIQQRYGVE